MFKTTIEIPFDQKKKVLQIQRTYSSTWILLVQHMRKVQYLAFKPLEQSKKGLRMQEYLVQEEEKKENCILYTEANGKVKAEYPFPYPVQNFQLLSDKKIFILRKKIEQFTISVIDLLKDSKKQLSFPLKSGKYKVFNVYRFTETGFLSIEAVHTACHQFTRKDRYFYYFSESSFEESKPLLLYQHTDSINSRGEINSSKGNQRSLIISQAVHKGKLSLLFHDILFVQGKAESRVRYIYEIGLADFWWEVEETVYIRYQRSKLSPLRTEQKWMVDEKNSQIQQITIKGIPSEPCELQIFSQTSFLRKSNFYMDGKICYIFFCWQMLMVYDLKLQTWTPFSYLIKQNPNQSIFREEIRFDQSLLNPSFLFHYDSTSKESVTVNILQFFRAKDMLMHLLLGLNQDFDDDLLSDTLAVIDCI